MPVRLMSPSLGNTSIEAGSWEFGISHRFLHSEDIYIGSKEQPQIKEAGLEPQIDVHSLDFSVRYGINQRWSASAIVPIVHSTANFPHPDGIRRDMGAGTELGDIRIQANYWVFDPATHDDGNLSVSLGIKFPTGDDSVEATFYKPTGPEKRAMDISLQPGDGGWGLVVEGHWFHHYKSITAYASMAYLINPSNTNGVEPPQSNPTNEFEMSVADQYSVRVGISYPRGAFSWHLGARVDGMPVSDLVGGSDGFRRPGYTVFAEPGVTWSFGDHILDISVPIAVTRTIKTSELDRSLGKTTGGGMADYVILTSYTMRF